MIVNKLIHEGGLAADSVELSMRMRTNYSLRPILLTETSRTGDHDSLLSFKGSRLDLQASDLYSPSTTNMALLFKTFAIAYDVGAVLYHSKNMAKAYAAMVKQFEWIRGIKGYEEPVLGYSSFGDQVEPYYEFDALLSAARRVYDKTAHFIWQAFEGGGGGTPGNITKLLSRMHHCPQPLAERLWCSWNEVGQKLKDYRDCTQHFASTDIGLCTVTMKRVDKGVWIAHARIPDNPEAKSKKKFRYDRGLDALTYGWEIANEIISVTTEIISVANAVASDQ